MTPRRSRDVIVVASARLSREARVELASVFAGRRFAPSGEALKGCWTATDAGPRSMPSPPRFARSLLVAGWRADGGGRLAAGHRRLWGHRWRAAAMPGV